MPFEKDPIGYAIHDYATNGFAENIIVQSDLCEDDIMPTEYFFRPLDLMPEIEKKALEMCKGRILDVGAAAGCHSIPLMERGLDVTAIDISKGAVDYLNSIGVNAICKSFFDIKKQYDTLLILMNGIGLSGKLSGLPLFLKTIKKGLKPHGTALCDSTDLTYLYREDDGSMWIDLNGSYFGEMQFKMSYKKITSEWFRWLYIEFDLLREYAEKEGLNCDLIINGKNNQYLASLTHQ